MQTRIIIECDVLACKLSTSPAQITSSHRSASSGNAPRLAPTSTSHASTTTLHLAIIPLERPHFGAFAWNSAPIGQQDTDSREPTPHEASRATSAKMPPKKQQAAPAHTEPPQRHTRAGRKRRNSDTSNASDRPSSSHSIASTPAKRRKRGKAAASLEPEVIMEEEEEEVIETASTGDAVDGAQVVVRPEMHVHFGGRKSSSIRLSEVEKTTATHITPHPHKKIPIKRRQTGSPSTNGEILTKKKITTTRHSLPPSLSQQVAAYVEEESHQFTSLHQILESKKQSLLALHTQRLERLQHLEDQKFSGRDPDGDIDAQIAELKQQIADDEESAAAELGNDMYVLESQEMVTYPELPENSSFGERVATKMLIGEESLSHSQFRSKEQIWASERQRLEDAILSLSREANDHKTKLQILEIELSALGLGEGVDSKAVLISIRESFIRIRESLEAILPGSLPEDISNEDVLDILVANVKEFADRLKIQDRELHEKSSLIADLGRQIDGLLSRLAEADFRREQLEERLTSTETDLDIKTEAYRDLEIELSEVQVQRDTYQDELDIKEKEVKSLFEALTDRDSNIDRLTQSLQHYQTEEKRLLELITRMEEEHGSTLAKMNQERENTVRDLEDSYDEQAQQRAAAEQLAEERQVAIDDLELQRATLEKERDSLRDQLDDMTIQRDAEADARETAEIDLQDRTVEVEDLATRVDRLEDELTDLTSQLEELRQLNETERTQRETAENALDTANEDIEELNEKLKTRGAEANELRSKLWEVQQHQERQLKEFEQAASDRDQQYQTDIHEEVDRREAAELESQERAATIEELQTRLEEVELSMSEQIAERDERIAVLEEVLTSKDVEIKNLRDDLKDTNDRFDIYEAETAQKREELESSIAALQTTISEHEATISSLQQEVLNESALHTSEIDDRNSTIAELNHDVAVLRTKIAELEIDKSSLERRVEQEAEQMLQLQAEKEDELEVLKATINDKQAKIQIVEQKAIETDQRWQDLLNAREEDIRELREAQTSSTETVSILESEIQIIKARFAEYIRKTTGRITHLQEDLARAKATADEEGAEIVTEGESLLVDFEAMGSMSATVTTKTTQSSSQKQASRKTRSKKRVQDSGIGMEDEDETMLAA
ncbi:hypothetical protein AC579_7996 [Pseudocercospora musae]|uniref:Uncharacterized protein n=1 Tax=Pseudocercospora musae TaxID=113226 RepID=A0A139I5F6_9PEZI|nr:hypothetical protein AC579_7996 [Pseudocercospora musae]